ncbi:aminoacyl-tRNA hydrolase [bacterium]|nr:MAG: aminoacyl-tRNA hydrolase [bacterium]
MDHVRLVVGLGNPGPAYASTRHNVGFRVVDALAERLGGVSWKSKHQALQLLLPARDALLIKPQTYMNASGDAVAPIAHFYRIPPERVLVVSDDMDLPTGKLRMRAGGSDGGQRGLRSIAARLGTQAFPRLRVGIGRPTHDDAVDHVLSGFEAEEETLLRERVPVAVEGIIHWLEAGTEPAMQFVNAPR